MAWFEAQPDLVNGTPRMQTGGLRVIKPFILWWNISTAGDVNGDGYSGHYYPIAPYYSNGQTSEGRTSRLWYSQLLVFATSNLLLKAIVLHGIVWDCRFPLPETLMVTGIPDVIIEETTLSNGQTNEGRVWVYHGSSVGISSATANWTARKQSDGLLFRT